MQLSQLRAFRVFIHEDNRISEFRRNPFSKNESDAFVFEQRSSTGEVYHKFEMMESTAEFWLKCALKVISEKPDLVSIEFDELSTGTTFNYPVPHI